MIENCLGKVLKAGTSGVYICPYPLATGVTTDKLGVIIISLPLYVSRFFFETFNIFFVLYV